MEHRRHGTGGSSGARVALRPAETRDTWDVLLADGQPVEAGSLTLTPMHSPGHTPACYAYQIGDAVFTGDVLFMPDSGTGRCDFPGGSAEQLYDSIQRIYALPDATRLFVGHDYQPGGREVKWQTTIGASKENNPQLEADTSRADFVEMRQSRDATLSAPRLLYASVQVNIDAGRLPEPHDNGIRYLVTPLNRVRQTDDAGAPIQR